MARPQKKEPVKKKPVKRKRVARATILTIQQIADGIGVSTTTVDKYVKRGCPRTSIEAIQKWRAENIKSIADDTDADEIGLALRRAELKEREENARTRQLKNDLMESRLIRREDVERDLSVGFARLVNRLNSLGLKCANICPTELKAPIKQSIEETIRIALKELSDDLRILV
jgi:phage terminase Nu1 subunit (DNA packaging protein)